jgi:hypothetical protein
MPIVALRVSRKRCKELAMENLLAVLRMEIITTVIHAVDMSRSYMSNGTVLYLIDDE